MVARVNDLFASPLGRGVLPKAFALAVLVEGLLFGATLGWFLHMHRTVPAAVAAPMRLSEVTLPPTPIKAPHPTPTPKVKPKPTPKPKPKHRPKPVRHLRPKPVRKPLPKPRPTPPIVATPPRAAPVAAASPQAMALFEGHVKAAVQAAVQYPPAARMMHLQGQARVGFDYRNGVVGNVHLVKSSGFALLDRAALAAVRSAHYPLPPPGEKNHRLHMSVWVQFREIDND